MRNPLARDVKSQTLSISALFQPAFAFVFSPTTITTGKPRFPTDWPHRAEHVGSSRQLQLHRQAAPLVPSYDKLTLRMQVGGVTETVGSTIGSKDIEQSGAQQRAQGDAEYKAAQAQGYAEGESAIIAHRSSCSSDLRRHRRDRGPCHGQGELSCDGAIWLGH